MRRSFFHRGLLLVLLLLPGFHFRLHAADGPAGLKPMLTVSFDSIESLMQRVGLGAQGIGFPEGGALFRRPFAKLLLLPGFEGIDGYRPGHFYLLMPDPPDRAPLPAVLLPLTDRRGERLLVAMKARYGTATRTGGIHTFADPGDAEDPEAVVLAIAEEHALLSTGIEGLHWLARHRRDRTLPVAADIGTPLRLTADGGVFGLFLQLFASLSAGSSAPEPAAGLQGLNEHLHEIGACCMACASLDLGFDASIREIAVKLRLNAVPHSALGRRLDGLRRPSAAFERLLPMPVLDGEISVLPALLTALPASTAPWLERLAESSHLLGLRLAPRTPGWVKLLLPVFNGQYAAGVLNSPLNQGLCSVQIFGFDEPLKAQAALSILDSLLAAPPHASPVRPLRPRILGDLRIVGYQVAAPATTNDAAGGGLGDVLTQLLGMGTVEMAAPGSSLFIVRGVTGTIDELLKRPADVGTLSCLERAERHFPSLKPGQTLLGAGQIAPVATLRAVAQAVPSLQGTRARLPFAGGELRWRAVKEGAGIVWELALPSSELLGWRQVRALDADVLQELLTQYALEQFGRIGPDSGQQEILRERLRRLRERRPDAANPLGK